MNPNDLKPMRGQVIRLALTCLAIGGLGVALIAYACN